MLLDLQYVPTNGSNNSEFPTPNAMKQEILGKLDELKASPAERIDILTALLDQASTTPQLVQVYEQMATKLTARIPIAQVLKRDDKNIISLV